jgi:actin-like ATPase involved in cell morphogenesis
MNENIIGIDIGTGSVKVATIHGTFAFPSIIARGKNMEIESKEIVLVGEQAVKQEQVKSMVLKTPIYRGAPTSIEDYLELIRHALDKAMESQDALYKGAQRYSDHTIVAGIPYSAKRYSQKIKDAVNDTFAPKFFGLMFQAKATLDNEGLDDGIICHIGQGTTEIMVVSHGNIAHAQTILHGVGDITNVITTSKTDYLNFEIFSKNSPELIEQRRILAAHISDSLEKVVIDYPQLQIICAGGGSLVPKLIQSIKNDTITHIRIAKDPVFSNALGMLQKASKC